MKVGLNDIGEPDEMIENRKKTEILAVMLKLHPPVNINFSDQYVSSL
jgi:hypothetical protein